MSHMDQEATAYWNHVNDLVSQWEEKVNVSRMTGADRHQYYKHQDLNGYASGTDYAPGGPSIVAEAGAELVLGPRVGYLPRGAQVIPHAQTMGMLGGGGGGVGGGKRITVEIPLVINGREFAR